MFQFRHYLFYAFVVGNLYGMVKSQENIESVCVLKDAPNQCGAFCLSAQLPFIDHNYRVQRQLKSLTEMLERIEKSALTVQKEYPENLERIQQNPLNLQKENQAQLDRIEKEIRESKAFMEIIRRENQVKLDRIEKGSQETQTTMEGIQTKSQAKMDSILQKAKIISLGFQWIESRYFYIENNAKLSWTSAENTCRKRGGHLAAFDNQKEFDAVTAKLHRNTPYWLGISDRKKEGEFVSESGNRPKILTFAHGEPNNQGGNEDCVDIYNGVMNDLPCDLQRHFICQLDKDGDKLQNQFAGNIRLLWFKTLENFEMIKFGILLLYASFACNLCGMAKSLEHTGSACVLTDAPNQCGAFCLSAQLPFIDHNYKVQGQLSSLTKILNEALIRLEEIEKAQKESAANVAKLQQENQAQMNKIEKELLESKATVERIQQENLAKMLKIENVTLESEKTMKEIQKIVQEHKVIPPGFQRIESRYFYIEGENKQTWANAEDTCRKKGGHLAAFKSRKELDAVTAKLREYTPYWLGISDQEKEGDFVTASGNRPIFLAWGRGEPNNLNKKEHCVDIFRGFMNDLPCNLTRFFICQLGSEV
ncbi:uncharacterized protein LOC128263575 [Drosophila gunungcola]|uniref:uncharacterized protein LOC128263575 n=1 Tax=Drosophila gunungcola TaxID=103775 RepID=UPI0022E6D293|nr:uncharacterized protein LOC128263575 [Drosophila gunungcola]